MEKIVSENITISDYSDDVLKQLEEVKAVILEELGMTMESFAKMHETAVDTGRLRNSITYSTTARAGEVFEYKDDSQQTYTYTFGDSGDDDAVYVGTNVEYAPQIEFFGGKNGRGKHFLEKALKDHKDVYNSIIKKHLDQPT